jgi:hypothetical protein
MNDGLKTALCNITTVLGKDGDKPVEEVVKDKQNIGRSINVFTSFLYKLAGNFLCVIGLYSRIHS